MLKQKLLARRGETLAEVLVAILVCSFSIMLLVGMVMTSMNINRAAREMDAGTDGNGGFYGALSDVETHTFTAADDPCVVRLTGGVGTPSITLDARSYTAADAALTVYGEVAP